VDRSDLSGASRGELFVRDAKGEVMTTVVREYVPISEARSQSAATTISSHPSRHSSIRAAIATAHANIALIKYWGKKDTLLRLPFTPSISMTVDQLYTTTRFEILPSADHNFFVLGGEEQSGAAAQRAFDYVRLLQQRFGVSGHFRIETVNHVPMSAGLASSSSAFAALAGAFAGAYGLHVSRAELSRMARLGSGSACRSIYGGLSEWLPGTDDHSSYAVALDEHPDIDLNLIAVQVDVSPKPISSTQGMARVVATSPYFPVWVQQTRKACAQMREAIQRKDFSAIGQIAQQNALDMHALNLTARPGFTYFQPDTIRAMRVVDDLRASGVECYYTMDAGSNLKVLVQSGDVSAVMHRLSHDLPHAMLTRAGFGPGISVSRLGEKE
jgi:diphosphomevalonate decarboxylase